MVMKCNLLWKLCLYNCLCEDHSVIIIVTEYLLIIYRGESSVDWNDTKHKPAVSRSNAEGIEQYIPGTSGETPSMLYGGQWKLVEYSFWVQWLNGWLQRCFVYQSGLLQHDLVVIWNVLLILRYEILQPMLHVVILIRMPRGACVPYHYRWVVVF